jgi:hypothetical protein
MADLEKVSIDIRDVDHEWFRDVDAYLDRDLGRYYFPRESAERLGELDEETGTFHLMDGLVEAEAGDIELEGRRIPAWSAPCDQLIVRPPSGRVGSVP